jgi:hypothetical protein
LKTFTYWSGNLIAEAMGHDIETAMTQTTLIGIQKDERVEVAR